MLKMSPSTALLPGPVSNRCWNRQLLKAVLERRGLGLLPSKSFNYNCCLVGGVGEVARSRAPCVPCDD